MIRPARVRRQVPSAVRGANLQARKTVKGAFENQMRQGDRRFEWISNHVPEKAIPLQTPVEIVLLDLRVDEDHASKFLDLRPERVQGRVRELATGHAATDGHTAEPELLDRMNELFARQIGKLECDGRERRKSFALAIA